MRKDIKTDLVIAKFMLIVIIIFGFWVIGYALTPILKLVFGY